MANLVLDASAVLAVLFGEPGADEVIGQLPGSLLSTVNAAEVAARSVDQGRTLEDTVRALHRLPLQLVPFDTEQSQLSASLRAITRPLGLSLGDRACLALGLQRQCPVLTGDRDWCQLRIGIEIQLFRP